MFCDGLCGVHAGVWSHVVMGSSTCLLRSLNACPCGVHPGSKTSEVLLFHDYARPQTIVRTAEAISLRS